MKANVEPLTFHPLRDAHRLNRNIRHPRADDETTGSRTAYLRFHRANTPAPECELDAEHAKPLVAAIAHELWKLNGGNDVLNWLEAEILLQNALAQDDAMRHKRSTGSRLASE